MSPEYQLAVSELQVWLWAGLVLVAFVLVCLIGLSADSGAPRAARGGGGCPHDWFQRPGKKNGVPTVRFECRRCYTTCRGDGRSSVDDVVGFRHTGR